VTDPTPPRWRTALWRGETAPIPVVRTPTRAVYPRRRPGEDAELAAVDQAAGVALRVGTLLLAGGAPTEDVEAAIFAVGSAVGLGVFEVDITFKSIIISVPPTADRPGYTDMRVVRGRSMHFGRVAATHRLVLDLSEGRIGPDAVETRLEAIERMRRPYPRWFVVLAAGALSAGITVQLGGNALTATFAFLTASVTGFIGSRLAARRSPTFFINLVLAFLSVMIVAGIATYEGTVEDLRIKTSLIIVAGIIGLLPGMSLMVAAQEAIGSFAVTSAARLVELSFATMGIVAGILIGLTLSENLGVALGDPTVRPDASAATVTLAIIAGGVAAAAASVTYQSPGRLVIVGGLVAALAVGVFVLTDNLLGESNANDVVGDVVIATAAAAIAIGLSGQLLGRSLRVPPVLVTVAGIIPLLPGLAVYEGLLALSRLNGSEGGDELGNAELVDGIGSLVEAISIALALAAGVLLGQLIARRLSRTARPIFVPPREFWR
jgi:uncharacterized membrane protein YjjP (DUF1212 family)